LKNPEFVIYTGCMTSGKTSRLLSAIDTLTYQKRNIIAFKPKIDNRFDDEAIVTHNGQKLSATPVSSGVELLEFILNKTEIEKVDIIAVDEAFMIDGVADTLIYLYRIGKTILVSSIEMSSTCMPFPEITKMLPWATTIEKCSAVCTICQADAFYTHRKTVGGDEIQVGGLDLYEARCWKCHGLVNELDNL
jgi:thymidine kinase